VGAQVSIERCYAFPGAGVIIFGRIKHGEVSEGAIGRNFKGKKFTLVKIEKEGHKIFKACKNDMVNLYIKNIHSAELKSGEVVCFD